MPTQPPYRAGEAPPRGASRLDALAESGAQQARVEAEASAARRTHAVRSHGAAARSERQVRRSLSPLGVFTGSVAWLVSPLVAVAIVGVLVGTAVVRVGDAIVAAIVAWIVCAAVLAFSEAVSRAAVNREKKWLASLPFGVEHYWEVLSISSGETGGASNVFIACCDEAIVRVTFAGTPERLAELGSKTGHALRGAAVPATVTAERQALVVKHDLRCLFSNAKLARWLHRLVEDVLLAVHEAEPIRAVEVSARRR